MARGDRKSTIYQVIAEHISQVRDLTRTPEDETASADVALDIFHSELRSDQSVETDKSYVQPP